MIGEVTLSLDVVEALGASLMPVRVLLDLMMHGHYFVEVVLGFELFLDALFPKVLILLIRHA